MQNIHDLTNQVTLRKRWNQVHAFAVRAVSRARQRAPKLNNIQTRKT